MIRRLLIANRGEIAVRIARTAGRMGIETVGVYSVPDENALHVDCVDLAVSLGGSTPAESYLRADAIIEAAVRTACDAIHPGYGFLAENAEFAESVIAANLVWVGPTPENIRLLGDKVAAKKAAVDAGVPTTAIHEISPGDLPDGLPMPALVKAAAGGGGRGMRVVREAADLEAAVAAAAREAESAFGDGTVFIEPYIEHGRHIEVQIFGDTHGNVVHLGERECSIQRRNQKIVEESPSAGIDETTRAAVCAGAVNLARHVGYENAGTVEFLVGEGGEVTFLEVNTRLQVEHPVTEAVTGLDLVELQLRIADGEPLPLEQGDVSISGHAIEVRVVAEDPAAGWMPSTGTLETFELDDAVRIDTGFRTGGQVSADYDSLLAKVIAHAPTRTGAAERLASSLRRSVVTGVETNLDSAAAILVEPDFIAAKTPTSYLDDHPDICASPDALSDEGVMLVLGAVYAMEGHRRSQDAVTGFAPSGWRNLRIRGIREVWANGARRCPVEYTRGVAGDLVLIGAWPEPGDDGVMSSDERRTYAVRLLRRTETSVTLEVDGVRSVLDCVIDGGDRVRVRSALAAATWQLEPRFVVPDASDTGVGPICPLPGTVLAVHVEPGQQVADGDLLVVVEAMKMEHSIRATTAGTVAALPFGVGDRVDAGDLLVEFAESNE